MLEALLPTVWPTVVVIDSTTLLTRGYRPRRRSSDETEQPDATGEAAEARVGNLKAGTIMLAFDGSLRRPQPCLMQVAGGKDVDSPKAFFASLAGAPDWVVADLDPAIGRAVRERWFGWRCARGW